MFFNLPNDIQDYIYIIAYRKDFDKVIDNFKKDILKFPEFFSTHHLNTVTYSYCYNNIYKNIFYDNSYIGLGKALFLNLLNVPIIESVKYSHISNDYKKMTAIFSNIL